MECREHSHLLIYIANLADLCRHSLKWNWCLIPWAQEVGLREVSCAKGNYLKLLSPKHFVIWVVLQEIRKACVDCTSYTCIFHPAVTAICLIKGPPGALLHFLIIPLKQKNSKLNGIFLCNGVQITIPANHVSNVPSHFLYPVLAALFCNLLS